jgi:hypothetical protein
LHSKPSLPTIPAAEQKVDQKASSSRLSRNRLQDCFSKDLWKSSFVIEPLLQLSWAEPYSIHVRQQQLFAGEKK